jgi:hypothetical protein
LELDATSFQLRLAFPLKYWDSALTLSRDKGSILFIRVISRTRDEEPNRIIPQPVHLNQGGICITLGDVQIENANTIYLRGMKVEGDCLVCEAL